MDFDTLNDFVSTLRPNYGNWIITVGELGKSLLAFARKLSFCKENTPCKVITAAGKKINKS